MLRRLTVVVWSELKPQYSGLRLSACQPRRKGVTVRPSLLARWSHDLLLRTAKFFSMPSRCAQPASSSPPNHGSRFGSATGLNQEKMVFDSLTMPGGYKRSGDETVSLTPVHFLSLVRLQLPPGIIRCRCQLHGEFKELLPSFEVGQTSQSSRYRVTRFVVPKRNLFPEFPASPRQGGEMIRTIPRPQECSTR
jgi:hypothetical protein